MSDCDPNPAIFCEMVPEIEYRNGVFYILDRCGNTTFRRCYLPHIFLAAVRDAQRAIDDFHAERAQVVQIGKRAGH